MLPPDAQDLAACPGVPHAMWAWHHHTLACQPRCDLHNPAALPLLLDLATHPGMPFTEQDISSWLSGDYSTGGTAGGGSSASSAATAAAPGGGRGSLAAMAKGLTGGGAAAAAAATDSQYVTEMVRYFVRHGGADEAPPRDSLEAHAVSSLF